MMATKRNPSISGMKPTADMRRVSRCRTLAPMDGRRGASSSASGSIEESLLEGTAAEVRRKRAALALALSERALHEA